MGPSLGLTSTTGDSDFLIRRIALSFLSTLTAVCAFHFTTNDDGVPHQSGASSSLSSSPSYSDPGPAADLSCGVFHSHHKTFFFSKSFPL